MEMYQIRYFLAMCEELNFTRAAEVCGVAQPSFSRGIKLLEKEFGGPLFHRERNRTHLTELGQVVRPYLQAAYAQATEARKQALDYVELRQTPLKLGIMCTIAATHFVELIVGIQTRNPGIELHIIDATARELEEQLLDGKLEVAIYCLPEGHANQNLHYLPLFREQFMIVLHPNDPLTQKPVVRIKDLRGRHYVNRANCEYNEHVDVYFTRQNVDCETVCQSERDDWILSMVAAGLGFSFVPELSINHGGVVARPLVEPEFWREVSLVTVRGRPHSPAVGALVREAISIPWAGKPALGVRETDPVESTTAHED